MAFLLGFALHYAIDDNEVEDAAKSTTDQATYVDKTSVIAPEIRRHGDKLWSNNRDGDETAEESAVAAEGQYE